MEIDIRIITECMDNIVQKNIKSGYEMDIEYATIYRLGLPVRKDTLYIMERAKDFEKVLYEEKSHFLIIGRLSKKVLSKTYHDVVCIEGGEPAELLNMVMEVIWRYQIWEEKMNQILIRGGSINELCQVSVPYFENTMVIQNRDFELYGVGENQEITYPYEYREGISQYLSTDIVMQGICQADLIFSRKGPFVYDYVPGYPSLLYNIFQENQYSVQICVDAVNRPFHDADFSKIIILGKYIEKAILYHRESGDEAGVSIANYFLEYMVHGSECERSIDNAIRMLGWESKKYYYICAIEISGTEKRNIGSGYISYFIAHHVADSINFRFDDWICLICSYDSDPDREKQIESIWKMQKIFEFKAGISDRFDDLYDMRDFFIQAKEIFRLNQDGIVEDKMVFYSEKRLQYLLRYGTKALPDKVLFQRIIQPLIEYDALHHQELFRDFNEYVMSDCNLTETAKNLNINRNTLKYRVKLIKKLLEFNLLDSEEALYYKLIMQYHKQKES